MKSKIIIFLSCINLLCSCNPHPSIYGTLQSSKYDGFKHKVYLIQPQKLNDLAASFLGKVIDSALVADDGSFAFQNLPIISQATLFEVAVQKKGDLPNKLNNEDTIIANYMPVVWQTGETLQISAELDNFQNSFQIKNPTAANKALLKLRDIKKEAFQQYLKNKSWDVHEGSQLLEKEEALLNYQKQLIAFAENTNQLLASLVAVRWVSPQNDYERVPEFLFQQCEKWNAKTPNEAWVKQLCDKAETEKLPLLKGAIFPDVALPMLNGDTVSVHSKFGKKLTVIDVWASWCVPCRKENRDVLVPLWDKYHNQGFQILAYGLETNKEAWEKAIEKDGAYRWLHASHLQGDDAPFMKSLRIQSIPANFILDVRGKVIAKNIHGASLQEFVSDYMNKY
ncbi:TlpA disulfide reductase family protein [Aequorivita sp. CIP111184]|uniref:TlpA family protein disulfide reductase n=1 Tax=Aequorivita sp. CIP111184 TaxID=2211356 RepID=UPI000DBC251B|nr:TlpA disulfide reductase family protein [Aequorivita sp. CIP111184]SRX54931.1 Thiol-disulfide oxidoreductase ResA [Aequorivita sp. CIP111184]